MTDLLVLDLVEKGLVTNQMVLDIGYDIDNMKKSYNGEVHIDHYGRTVPKPAHGSVNLGKYTSSSKLILEEIVNLYERITQPDLLVRRVTVTANHVICEDQIPKEEPKTEQMDLFTDYAAIEREQAQAEMEERKEKAIQRTLISLKNKFGKNIILKGSNFRDGGMTIKRNQQIGGHKA